ncbi:MAG: DUF4363 family protein [Firmicutes bacterium]|nr:DUF4363 family protein [Bacillota bacterium]
MRLLISLSVIIVIFIGFAFHIQNDILAEVNDMRSWVAEITDLVQKEDWHEARINILNLRENWKEIEGKWDLFLSHHEIDEFDLILVRVISFIESKESPSALAELASLYTKLGHIYSKESLSFQNIL